MATGNPESQKWLREMFMEFVERVEGLDGAEALRDYVSQIDSPEQLFAELQRKIFLLIKESTLHEAISLIQLAIALLGKWHTEGLDPDTRKTLAPAVARFGKHRFLIPSGMREDHPVLTVDLLRLSRYHDRINETIFETFGAICDLSESRELKRRRAQMLAETERRRKEKIERHRRERAEREQATSQKSPELTPQRRSRKIPELPCAKCMKRPRKEGDLCGPCAAWSKSAGGS